MSGRILATKLHIPPVPGDYLRRPRLLEEITTDAPLTLVSASAGFGKSSLISDWLSRENRPAAWISLEDEDSDPDRFRAYLTAALLPLLPGLGEENPLLEESTLEGFLTELINHIDCCTDEITLVLDDYHLIDSKEIDELLRFLIEHAPRQFHLIIATREDPQFPLARWRSKRRMHEIREGELRFTKDEILDYLKIDSGFPHSDTLPELLFERTEGWITGLRLAALSLKDRDDADSFLRDFDGSHHFILDYLMEEVLNRQPPERVAFLLATGLFQRFSPGLADRVLELPSGRGALIIEEMQRENLFIIPLDEHRHWFRYHHLFKDLLKKRALMDGDESARRTYLSRGAGWFAEEEEFPEAIETALAAGEAARAAAWAELAWPRMENNFHSAGWLRLVESIDEEIIRTRPRLASDYAWARMNRGELEAADEWFAAAEKATGPDAETELRFAVGMGRIYLSQARGEYAIQERLIKQTRSLLEKTDRLRHAQLDSLEGLARWNAGWVEAAYLIFEDAEAGFQASGSSIFALSAAFAKGLVAESAGRLKEAEMIFRTAAERNERTRASFLSSLAGVQLEQYRLNEAEASLEESRKLGERSALPGWNYRRRIIEIRLAIAQGEYDRAERLLGEAAALRYRGPMPERFPPEALQALIDIERDEVGLATSRLSRLAPDKKQYTSEFPLLVKIRAQLAHRTGDEEKLIELNHLLKELRLRAEEQERRGSLTDILLMEAVAAEVAGERDAASAYLTRALAVAEADERALPFLRGIADEKIIARLLQCDLEQTKPSPFGTTISAHAPGLPTDTDASRPLGESLSPRETEVLTLIAAGYSNQRISETLFLALSTIKGHNAKIYEKLDVKRRTEAVAKAQKLGLIPPVS